MISSVFAVNGAVTINVGVNASGTLNPKSVALLAKMPGGSTSASAPAATTHTITLYYPTTDRIELNALQVRCLGDAIVRPEDAPVAEVFTRNNMEII